MLNNFGITLGGKAKEFEWKYNGEKIIISREVGKLHSNIQSEFKTTKFHLYFLILNIK